MLKSILAISAGASSGAALRWLIGLWLNGLHPLIAIGTLGVNLAGGYLIGLFISLFAWNPSIGPEWRLLIITGFLGSLTTFSTFSAEVVLLMQEGKIAAACANIALHVVGSLAMTFLGIFTFSFLKG
jgi:CrcB protein